MSFCIYGPLPCLIKFFLESIVREILDDSRLFCRTMNSLIDLSVAQKRPASSYYRRPAKCHYRGGNRSLQESYQYSTAPKPTPGNHSLLTFPGSSGYQLPSIGRYQRGATFLGMAVVINNSPFMKEPPKAKVLIRTPIPGAEVEADIDILVGARLQLFERMWTRDAWSHRTVSKGLSWSWLGKPPRFRIFFQRSDHS